MPDTSRSQVRVGLILPPAGAVRGAMRGAVGLAHWVVAHPQLQLVGLEETPVARANALADRLVRLEARLRPGPPPGDLPATEDTGAPDVVVDLSDGTPNKGEVPPLGVWHLTASQADAAIRPLATGAAATEVTLLCTRADATTCLARARYSPKPTAGLNASFIAEKAVLLVMRALAEVALTGALPSAQNAGGAPPAAPSLLRYVIGLGPTLFRRASTRVAQTVGWQPGVFAMRLCPGGPFDFDPKVGTTLVPPQGRFWADPFLVSRAGEEYLFYEEFHEATQRGVLKVARLRGDRMEELGETVTRPHHLSFPFVFDAQGAHWMLPETSRGGRVEVWRAVDFPLRWELAATAMDGRAPADAVLAEVEGAWWLFAHFAQDATRDYCSELHVFRVDGPLLRRIEPHPLNPVVIDSRTARAGGRVWSEGGRLFRASQDNAHGVYGWGLNIMEITRLDLRGYAERPVRHIGPGFLPGVMGCHHMDFVAGRVVIDMRYLSARAARHSER
ncbi:MAG: hypothetical protein AAGB05_00090 [Pseudomonadota bacterium]